MYDLRLCELVPVKTFEPDGAFQITFIDRAKNLETRIIPTKKEALELYNICPSSCRHLYFSKK